MLLSDNELPLFFIWCEIRTQEFEHFALDSVCMLYMREIAAQIFCKSVSHWCEAALRSENILTIRAVFCLADSQLFVAPLPLPASPVPACYLFSYPRSSDQSRCKSPPYSIPFSNWHLLVSETAEPRWAPLTAVTLLVIHANSGQLMPAKAETKSQIFNKVLFNDGLCESLCVVVLSPTAL